MVLLEDEEYRDLKSRADKSDRSEQLEKEKLALETLARQNAARIAELEANAERLKHNNAILMEHYSLSRQKQFGTSSEKTPVAQEQMLFNEAEACEDPGLPEPELKTLVAGYTRGAKSKGKRDRDYSGLPTEEIRYTVPEADRNCPQCGEYMHTMGEEVRKELKFIPASVTVVLHIREKCACRRCQVEELNTPIVTAQMPKPAFPRSPASPSLVAYIMNQKYVMACPLYRQEQEFKRLGFEITRQTMANWMIAGSNWLEHLFNRMHTLLCERDILHADETRIQVLNETGRTPQSESFMWLYRSGRYGPPICLFEYQQSRATEHPLSFLEDFSGYLHVDGYSVYNKLPGVTPVGCLAHARRGFVDVIKLLPPSIQKNGDTHAHAGRNYCNRLYAIERDLKDVTPEERFAGRRIRSTKVLAEFRAWIDSMASQVTDGSNLGKAINYCRNQWTKLNAFLADGRLEIDNNRAERTIKPFVMGRRNWLFANSMKGAKASAIIYSIVETAKDNNLNPQAYLTYLFEQLPNIDVKDDAALDQILPWAQTPQAAFKVPDKPLPAQKPAPRLTRKR